MKKTLGTEITKLWSQYSFVTPIYGKGNIIEGFIVDGSRTTADIVNLMIQQYIRFLNQNDIPVMLEVGFGENPNPVIGYGYIGVSLDNSSNLVIPNGNLPIMALFKGTDITNVNGVEPVDLIVSNRPFPNSGGLESFNLDVQFVHETQLLKVGGFIVVIGQASTFDQHFRAAMEKYSYVSPYKQPPTQNGSATFANFQNESLAMWAPMNIMRRLFSHLEILQQAINSAHGTSNPLVLIFQK